MGQEQLAILMLGTAGLGFTLLQLEQGVASMEGQHYVIMAIMLVVGYAAGRLFPTWGRMVGLP